MKQQVMTSTEVYLRVYGVVGKTALPIGELHGVILQAPYDLPPLPFPGTELIEFTGVPCEGQFELLKTGLDYLATKLTDKQADDLMQDVVTQGYNFAKANPSMPLGTTYSPHWVVTAKTTDAVNALKTIMADQVVHSFMGLLYSTGVNAWVQFQKTRTAENKN